MEDPSQRISAKTALNHQFFSDHELLPTIKDMVLLPTNVLRLLNVLDDPKYKQDEEIKGNLIIPAVPILRFNIINFGEGVFCLS